MAILRDNHSVWVDSGGDGVNARVLFVGARIEMPRGIVREDCEGLCAGNHNCVLYGDVKHEMCVCGDSECACHTRERYEVKRVSPFKGIRVYKLVPVSACPTQ
jgi:hypothetical protein